MFPKQVGEVIMEREKAFSCKISSSWIAWVIMWGRNRAGVFRQSEQQAS
jgi:hypothetical protein